MASLTLIPSLATGISSTSVVDEGEIGMRVDGVVGATGESHSMSCINCVFSVRVEAFLVHSNCLMLR